MADPRAELAAIGRQPDEQIAIAEAALAFARIDRPGDDAPARDHLTMLAARAQALPDPGAPAGRAAALGEIFATLGYAGAADNYDDPANANLIAVIERRRGLPVALGVLWLHAAAAAGWPACGLDVPAHFLLAIAGAEAARPAVVVDVFAGGAVLGGAALGGLLASVGATADPGQALVPMSPRAVLLRLQNNIRLRRSQAGDTAGALAATEDMLLLAPQAMALWREAAGLNRRLDRLAAAAECLRHLAAGTDAAAAAARAELATLQRRLN